MFLVLTQKSPVQAAASYRNRSERNDQNNTHAVPDQFVGERMSTWKSDFQVHAVERRGRVLRSVSLTT